MVKNLPWVRCVAGEAEQRVHGVVEIAADAGAAQTGGFGFEVKHLADQPGFTQQFAVAPGGLLDLGVEFGHQGHDKHGIGRYRLVAAQRAQGTGQRGVQGQLMQRHFRGAARNGAPVQVRQRGL